MIAMRETISALKTVTSRGRVLPFSKRVCRVLRRK